MIVDLKPISDAWLDVWIDSEGQRLPEYGASAERGWTTCFVPSTEGKTFSIRFRVIGFLSFTLAVDPILDGVDAIDDGKIVEIGYQGVKTIESIWVTATTKRPFRFGRLNLSDDAPIPMDCASLGTIQLRLSYVAVNKCPMTLHPKAVRLPGMGAVHETTKKGGIHAITLGKEQPDVSPTMYSCHSLNIPESVAVFQYAPEDYLRAQEVIPRSKNLARRSPSRAINHRPQKHKCPSSPEIAHISFTEAGQATDIDTDSLATYNCVKVALETKRRDQPDQKRLKIELGEIVTSRGSTQTR